MASANPITKIFSGMGNFIEANKIAGFWSRFNELGHRIAFKSRSDSPTTVDGMPSGVFVSLYEHVVNDTVRLSNRILKHIKKSDTVIIFCTLSASSDGDLPGRLDWCGVQFIDKSPYQRTSVPLHIAMRPIGSLAASATLSESASISSVLSKEWDDSTSPMNEEPMGFRNVIIGMNVDMEKHRIPSLSPRLPHIIDMLRFLVDVHYLGTYNRYFYFSDTLEDSGSVSNLTKRWMASVLIRVESSFSDNPGSTGPVLFPSYLKYVWFIFTVLSAHDYYYWNKDAGRINLHDIFRSHPIVRFFAVAQEKYVRMVAMMTLGLIGSRDSSPVLTEYMKTRAIKRFVCQSHKDLLTHLSNLSDDPTIGQWLLPGCEIDDETEEQRFRFWKKDPSKRGHYHIHPLILSYVDKKLDFGTFVRTEEGYLLVSVTTEILMTEIIPVFQRFIVYDNLINIWNSHEALWQGNYLSPVRLQGKLRLIPAFNDIYLSLQEVCALDDKGIWSQPHPIMDLLENKVGRFTHNYSSVIREHWVTMQQYLPTNKRSRQEVDFSDFGVDTKTHTIAELIPDIESLTSYLPPCLKRPIVVAHTPNQHLKNIDRMPMGYYLRAMGYSSDEAKRYTKADASIYSGSIIPGFDPLTESMGCSSLVTYAKNRHGACQLKCPYASAEGVNYRQCRTDMGLPANLAQYHPLQIVYAKIQDTHKS